MSTGGTMFNGHITDIDELNLISFTRLRGVATRNCADRFDFDCTETLHVQFIDGRVVLDRLTNVCRPVSVASP